MKQHVVTVFGGSGFLGTYVVKALAEAGYMVQVICRDAEAASFLKTAGEVGQIVIRSGDICKAESWQDKLAGSKAVINLVGVFYGQNADRVHHKAPGKLAEIARESGVEQFIHVSALGVERATTCEYARTKKLGEEDVRRIFPDAVIFRPSVLFGPEDNFFNQFARMAAMSPVLPLIGGGKTKFQPVYVADVARAIVSAVRNNITARTFELAGPETFSFRDIQNYILRTTGLKAKLVSIPFPIASIMGAFASLLPKPPLTRDQVALLKYDNIAQEGMPGFDALGIQPASVETLVPGYLARFVQPTSQSIVNQG